MNLQIVDPPKASDSAPIAGPSASPAATHTSAATSIRRALGAGMALFAIVLSGASHGAVTEYATLDAFNAAVGTSGPGSADFSTYSGMGDPSFSGTVGLLGWTATAAGGMFAGSGVMSTNFASTPMTFSFSDAGSIAGIGGQFFATDQFFATAESIVAITVTLADGTDHAFTRSISSSSDFWGFQSSNSAIASLTIAAAADLYASTGALTFRTSAGGPNDVGEVPEPSSLALVAAALALGAAARRRKVAS